LGNLNNLSILHHIIVLLLKKMTKLVLEIPNQKDLELLLSFAKRLKVNVLEIEQQEKSPIYWLEQLSKIDSFKEIEDPVSWQRNIRTDRKLPFRD